MMLKKIKKKKKKKKIYDTSTLTLRFKNWIISAFSDFCSWSACKKINYVLALQFITISALFHRFYTKRSIAFFKIMLSN